VGGGHLSSLLSDGQNGHLDPYDSGVPLLKKKQKVDEGKNYKCAGRTLGRIREECKEQKA